LGFAIERAKKIILEQPNHYLVLLVLTDGGLQDYPQTCDLLIQCSRLPLSVIIVGIGSGDFGLMHNIDDNRMLMTDKFGRRTERDLVTFVELAKCNYNPGLLAHEVMKELPRQITEYCRLVGLKPEDMRIHWNRLNTRDHKSHKIGGSLLASVRSQYL
jgi:hypothetical protein